MPINTPAFSLFELALAGVMLSRFRAAAIIASQLQRQLAAARNAQEMLLAGQPPASPGCAIEAGVSAR